MISTRTSATRRPALGMSRYLNPVISAPTVFLAVSNLTAADLMYWKLLVKDILDRVLFTS